MVVMKATGEETTAAAQSQGLFVFTNTDFNYNILTEAVIFTKVLLTIIQFNAVICKNTVLLLYFIFLKY